MHTKIHPFPGALARLDLHPRFGCERLNLGLVGAVMRLPEIVAPSDACSGYNLRRQGEVQHSARARMRHAYREDIDGLRALAVLSVIGFHFEAPRIFGGFVGVDIFFVISGFLITGIIQTEIRENSFSFSQFYQRRVRRLLPALYVMIFLTALFSFHYLLTSERLEFFRSAMAAATFTSNFFFWLQSGYFDHAAAEKPLLHTWSLAVEEQFYLALPPVLWAVLHTANGRKSALPIALAFIGGASLLLSMWLIATGRSNNAFFMSPPRFWEFLIGSAIAIEGFPVLNNRVLQHSLRGVAVALILIPVFTYNQYQNFPGYRALLPCMGAALFIWCGTGIPNRVRHPLSFLSILRFCGQISYSLYLWHWPLFTFARFSKASLTLDILDKTLLFALTVTVSYLSWRFVEQPFRKPSPAMTPRAVFGMAGLSIAGLLACCAAGIFYSQTSTEADRYAVALSAYNSYDVGPIYRAGSCFQYDGHAVDQARCLTMVTDKQNVLLWGDSYAAQYYYGLNSTIDPQRINLLQATQAACMPTMNVLAQGNPPCRSFAGHMEAFFGDHKPDLVILSADWLEYARPPRFDSMIADIKQTISRLNKTGAAVILLGPTPQFRSRLPAMLTRAHLLRVDPAPGNLVLPEIFPLDEMMKAALPEHEGFSYISVLDAVCHLRQCPLTIDGGVPLAWDQAHLTAQGSAYIIGRLNPMLGLTK
jgi:peptidoglycan/LPS O-acetylase OafA/YrhL